MDKAPLWVFILGMAMSVCIILFGVARIRKVNELRREQENKK